MDNSTIRHVIGFILIVTLITIAFNGCPDNITGWKLSGGFGGFGTEVGEFNKPKGFVFEEMGVDGFPMFVVADNGNSRIQVLSLLCDGDTCEGYAFGGFGDSQGLFDGPTNVAVSWEERPYIYVADTGNDRIQKFTVDGTFVLEFGNSGPDSIRLGSPTGLVSIPDGRILVVDSGHHRIQVFDWDGGFITSWGRQGNGPGEFNSPIDICRFKDYEDKPARIGVSDYDNNRVQVFDLSGDYVRSFNNVVKPLGVSSWPSTWFDSTTTNWTQYGGIYVIGEQLKGFYFLGDSVEVITGGELERLGAPYDIWQRWLSDMTSHSIQSVRYSTGSR